MRNRGLQLTIASMALMQLAPLLNKFAVEYIDPIQAATLNTALVSAFAGLYGPYKHRGGLFRVRQRGLLLLLGAADAAGVLFLYMSLELISPVMFGLLGRLYVVFAVLLGVILLNERLDSRDVILVMLAILGSIAFSYGGVETTAWLGVVLAVGYTFFFALSNLLAKLAIEGADSTTILFYNKTIGLAVLLAYGGATGGLFAELPSLESGLRGVGFVTAAALISNGIGLLLFYESLRHMEFHRVNVIRSAGPLLAAAYAWWWFPVTLSLTNIAGGAVLLFSIAALANKSRPKEPTASTA